jgi:hypothetical protein
MASAELHLEVGPQYVEAAKQVVEQATAPLRGLGEYIMASGSEDGMHWPYVVHRPCGTDVWRGKPGSLADVLKEVAGHDCGKAGDGA